MGVDAFVPSPAASEHVASVFRALSTDAKVISRQMVELFLSRLAMDITEFLGDKAPSLPSILELLGPRSQPETLSSIQFTSVMVSVAVGVAQNRTDITIAGSIPSARGFMSDKSSIEVLKLFSSAGSSNNVSKQSFVDIVLLYGLDDACKQVMLLKASSSQSVGAVETMPSVSRANVNRNTTVTRPLETVARSSDTEVESLCEEIALLRSQLISGPSSDNQASEASLTALRDANLALEKENRILRMKGSKANVGSSTMASSTAVEDSLKQQIRALRESNESIEKEKRLLILQLNDVTIRLEQLEKSSSSRGDGFMVPGVDRALSRLDSAAFELSSLREANAALQREVHLQSHRIQSLEQEIDRLEESDASGHANTEEMGVVKAERDRLRDEVDYLRQRITENSKVSRVSKVDSVSASSAPISCSGACVHETQLRDVEADLRLRVELLASLRDQVTFLERENQILKMELAEVAPSGSRQVQAIDTAREEDAKLDSEGIEHHHFVEARLKGLVRELQSRLDDSLKVRAALQAEAETFNRRANEIQDALRSSTIRIEIAEDKLSAAKQQSAADKLQYQSDCEELESFLEAERNGRFLDAESASFRQSQLDSQLSSARTRIASLESELAKTRSDARASQLQHEDECGRLCADLDALEMDNDRLTSELTASKGREATAEDENNSLQRSLDSARRAVRERDDEIEACNDQVSELRNRNAQLYDQLVSESSKVTSLLRQLERSMEPGKAAEAAQAVGRATASTPRRTPRHLHVHDDGASDRTTVASAPLSELKQRLTTMALEPYSQRF